MTSAERLSTEQSSLPVRIEAAFALYARPLVRWLRIRGASAMDAEDAMQSAFISLWRNFSSMDNPGAYLHTAAWRTWQQTRAAASRAPGMEPEEALYDIPASAAGPMESAEFHQERWEILQLTARLPERQQAVLAYYIDDAPTSEIAHRLGLSQTTVRSTLRYARRRLAEMLRRPEEADIP
ncbi:RNA polymerase sigma factor [Streptomyces sp. NPDC012935]|uniref:RNA polymerase sigma factor n=1 Tax=Streptomyces sp. NPDC012935 TaxID=3364857 RepID=UPI0036C22197